MRATLASLDTVLAEPIEDCLLPDADGRPCVEAKTPLDLEAELGMPGGHIFHRDLSWPFAADPTREAGAWGVETPHERDPAVRRGRRRAAVSAASPATTPPWRCWVPDPVVPTR